MMDVEDSRVTYNVDISEIREFINSYYERNFRSKWTPSPGEDIPIQYPPDYLDKLLQVLENGETDDQPVAARRIGEMGSAANSAIPTLLRKLEGADANLAREIEWALANVGPPPRGIEKLLIDTLQSSSEIARAYAIRALIHCDPGISIPAFLNVLEQADDRLAREIEGALALIGAPPADSEPVLLNAVQSKSPRVRRYAVRMFAKGAPKLPLAGLDAVSQLLGDSSPEIRQNALLAIAAVGAPARPILIKKIETMPQMATELEKALLQLPPPDASEERLLADCLLSESAVVRTYAARMFANNTPRLSNVYSKRAIDRILIEPQPPIRDLLIQALVNMGAPAPPLLISTIEQPITPEDLRGQLVQAMYKLPPPDADSTGLLLEALNSIHLGVQGYAIQMFANGTPRPPREAVPRLVVLYKTGPVSQRANILQIFALVGPPARSAALPIVFDSLIDKDAGIRAKAEKALAAFGPAQAAEKPFLLDKIRHSDIRIRRIALAQLLPLATPSDTFSLWVPLLKDEDVELRRIAARACTSNPEIWRQVEQHVPQILNDPDSQIRLMAAKAIRQTDSIGNLLYQAVVRRLTEEQEEAVSYELALSVTIHAPMEAAQTPILAALLRHPKGDVRLASLLRIQQMGGLAAEALPAIVERLKDPVLEVRLASLGAIAAMRTRAEAAVPVIEQILKQSEQPPPMRQAAVDTLAALGPKGREAITFVFADSSQPAPLRERILYQLLRSKGVGNKTLVEMIAFAEEVPTCRQPLTNYLTREYPLADEVLTELLLCTSAWKPRSRTGGRDVRYPVEYRRWAIDLLGRLNPAELTTTQRQKIVDRLNYLVKNDSTPEIVSEAKTALQRLGR